VAAAQPAPLGDAVTRQASVANAAVAAAGTEEEIWFDANSNFSRSNSSAYMSAFAGGDDGSGFWPGRMMNFSRPVSQVLLVAGNEDSPTRHALYGSRVPSGVALASGQGLGLAPSSGFDSRSNPNFSLSRRPSLQQMRSKATTGSGSGTGLAAVKEQEIRPEEPGDKEGEIVQAEAVASGGSGGRMVAAVAVAGVSDMATAAAATDAATAATAADAGTAVVDTGAEMKGAGASGADGSSSSRG
ncbi:hypothetical protein Vretifemale_13646, partial [Volvox reticuliferus]